MFGYHHFGDATPTCLESADADTSGAVDIADGIAILEYHFAGSSPPAPCARDVGPPRSVGDQGYETFGRCE